MCTGTVEAAVDEAPDPEGQARASPGCRLSLPAPNTLRPFWAGALLTWDLRWHRSYFGPLEPEVLWSLFCPLRSLLSLAPSRAELSVVPRPQVTARSHAASGRSS